MTSTGFGSFGLGWEHPAAENAIGDNSKSLNTFFIHLYNKQCFSKHLQFLVNSNILFCLLLPNMLKHN